MYILPNATEFNNACASVDRTIATKCEVISGGVTTTMVGDGINGEIISMEWDNIVCSNDGLQIGTTCMDEFKMTYRPVTTTMSLMGKEIHPYVGLEFGSPATVTYVPLGVFYVTDSSTEDDGYTVNITAYDGMQRFMKDFNATTIGVTFPCKAWELLEAIATYFGVTLTYDAIVYALLSSDDYYLYTSDNYRLVVSDAIDKNKHASLPKAYEGTYRDYIGWIVGLVGAYAHMGRNGDLVVSQYKDHGFEVGRNVQHMGGAKINYGGAVTYTSIVSGTEENPIYPTYYGGNAITYTNPFITQSELDYLCEGLLQVDGITVTPCDVAWRSNPCVDAGDIVSVVDKDGNNLSVYVMERVVRVTGGLAEELHCYGETEVAHTLNKSPLVTSFNNKINEAIKTASDYINNTKGVFEWIDNGDGTNGGFTIYETDDDKSWLRCTAGGIGISADGGLTYTNAITKNGVVSTQLDVQNNGKTLFFAGYDEEVDGTSISTWSPDYDGKMYEISSGRWLLRPVGEDPYFIPGSWLAKIVLRNPEDDVDKITMQTARFLLPGAENETNMTQILLTSGTTPEDKSAGISASANISSRDVAYSQLGVTATNSGAIFLDENATRGYPTIQVLDPTVDSTSHYLKLMKITINGVQYYMFASTS